MNYFDILDVNEFSTKDEIKEKYRKSYWNTILIKLSNGTSSIAVDDIKKSI